MIMNYFLGRMKIKLLVRLKKRKKGFGYFCMIVRSADAELMTWL